MSGFEGFQTLQGQVLSLFSGFAGGLVELKLITSRAGQLIITFGSTKPPAQPEDGGQS